ncbi:hypothetical protein K488DRAFT_39409 [Vararia minispora EC-137]|uniref:Uncharacterized protein n=1 Tax=Vararia minispora EC-137 TaxID=1314806 RepID=A0ACB8QZD9_9AGAM|nr:hypothetical protein K488DRAFT_39409 [Vararia minispora EC-137]
MFSSLVVDASDYPIKSVTVFKSSKAEVVRTFRVPLQAGENKVEIRSLPSSIDTESARVTGLGDAQLFDVVCSVSGVPSISSANSSAEAIRLLTTKKRTLEEHVRNIDQVKSHVASYGASLKAEHIAPADAELFFDRVLARQVAFDERATQLNEEILRVSREIDLKMHENNTRVGNTAGTVTVIVMAREETEVEFKLIYIVTGASWNPAYELHATAAKAGHPGAEVSLQYRASVTQKTGEDWTGVSLTLSTAPTDTSQDSIPDLKPTRLRPPPPPPAIYAIDYGAATPQRRPLGEDSEDTITSGDWEEPVETQTLREHQTIVKESPLAHAYTVEGLSSVPSDNITHKVSIATLLLYADIQHVAVPKVKAVAYLQARVKNTSDYRLMPGAVHVFMDDSFVSKTSIMDIAPGDTFDCALGSDAGMRVSYARLSKKENKRAGVFSEQTLSTTFTARTILRNTHQYALDAVIVRDNIPVSDDNTKVRVVLNKPQVLADAEDNEDREVTCEEGGNCIVRWTKVDDASKGGKKDGMYEWMCKVGPGEKVVLLMAWTVKSPAEVKWVEVVG